MAAVIVTVVIFGEMCSGRSWSEGTCTRYIYWHIWRPTACWILFCGNPRLIIIACTRIWAMQTNYRTSRSRLSWLWIAIIGLSASGLCMLFWRSPVLRNRLLLSSPRLGGQRRNVSNNLNMASPEIISAEELPASEAKYSSPLLDSTGQRHWSSTFD